LGDTSETIILSWTSTEDDVVQAWTQELEHSGARPGPEMPGLARKQAGRPCRAMFNPSGVTVQSGYSQAWTSWKLIQGVEAYGAGVRVHFTSGYRYQVPGHAANGLTIEDLPGPDPDAVGPAPPMADKGFQGRYYPDQADTLEMVDRSTLSHRRRRAVFLGLWGALLTAVVGILATPTTLPWYLVLPALFGVMTGVGTAVGAWTWWRSTPRMGALEPPEVEVAVQVSQAGVLVAAPGAWSFHSWQDLVELRVTEGAVTLWASPASAFLLPRRHFPGAMVEAAIRWCSAHDVLIRRLDDPRNGTTDPRPSDDQGNPYAAP